MLAYRIITRKRICKGASFLLSPSPSCVSTGSTWPVGFRDVLCVLAKGLFYLWQVRLLSCKTKPPKPPPPLLPCMSGGARQWVAICFTYEWADQSAMLECWALFAFWASESLSLRIVGAEIIPEKSPGVLLFPPSSQTLWPWSCCQAACCHMHGPPYSHTCTCVRGSWWFLVWPQLKGFHFPSELNLVIRWFAQSHITCISTTILHVCCKVGR